jgi:hypothetical protein
MPFAITWMDAGRWPRVKPNPQYPDGKDISLAKPGQPSCKVDLPYPARRIGTYVVVCDDCGLSVGVTTAGRRDDPRSVELPCKKKSDT